MTSPLIRAAAAMATAILLVPAVVLAQPAQTGRIAGQVADTDGAVLPGVTITVTNTDLGISRSASTDQDGNYVFPLLPGGRYTVSVEAPGFRGATATDNVVEIGKTTRVSFDLTAGSATDPITVIGDVPIIDASNQTVETRISSEEFEPLPIFRHYKNLLNLAPGVILEPPTGTGSLYSHGGGHADNTLLFDGIDVTDPATGTFGIDLPFEAIQQVVVNTSGLSAEYGKGVGATVNVVTKSGTNTLRGSYKFLMTNDNWNGQNTTTNEATGAPLDRTKFDELNPTHSVSLGGPIRRSRAWFFTTYEFNQNTTGQRQTAGPVPENYQQATESNFFLLRLNTQLGANNNLWFKYHRTPTDGFVVDYWAEAPGFAAGERSGLTKRDEIAQAYAAQWTSAFRSNWTADATFAGTNQEFGFSPFQSAIDAEGGPHLSIADRRAYNGATFDGFVKRPRIQFNAATTYFLSLGGNAHSFKAGFDWQGLESSNQYGFPNGQLFIDTNFNQVTRAIVPSTRQDFEAGGSTSKGNVYALYFRDKFELGKRLFGEAGLRYEKQRGTVDPNLETFNTNTIATRLSATYDLGLDGKTLLVGSYGRFYQGVIQDFSDAFAGIPAQENYNLFTFNPQTGQYVSTGSFNGAATRVGTTTSNEDLTPAHVDEFTFGVQRQVGQRTGVGVRAVFRTWGDLIDDVRSFNSSGNTTRTFVNYETAERTYKGIEFTFDKRLSNNWYWAGNYTYSHTEGNHFGTHFTGLGDYLDATCGTSADPGIGTNGRIPCREVNEGANTSGVPEYDRPHAIKFFGAYTRPFGPVNVTAGLNGRALSKRTFTQQRTVSVLSPQNTAIGTANYLYEPLGAGRIDGMDTTLDFALEGGFRPWGGVNASMKFEVFNLFDSQGKVGVDNLTYCSGTTGVPAACAATRTPGSPTLFGAATTRGSFQFPRAFRYSVIFRF